MVCAQTELYLLFGIRITNTVPCVVSDMPSHSNCLQPGLYLMKDFCTCMLSERFIYVVCLFLESLRRVLGMNFVTILNCQ